MLQSSLFQMDASLPWQDLGNGVQRKIMGFNSDLMLVRVKFEKGAVGTLHHHLHTQASYVESGEFELSIGTQKKILKQGDGYYVPPNEEHGCVCQEAGVLIDAFSPIREDFLT